MDVRDLAPALLAVGQLFDAANSVLNGDRATISVNVNATSEACFEIDLELSQKLGKQIVELFSGDTVTSALQLKEVVLIGGVGLIWLVRKLCGKNPGKLEKVDDTRVKITVGGETFEVPIELLRLYQDIPVRDALEKLIREPLQRDGIDKFEVREEGVTRQEVREEECDYFSRPNIPDETLIEDTRRAAFSILSLAFKQDNKWRLFDGNAPISALIEDKYFLHRVDSNQIAFSKGDLLICDVRMTQSTGRDGLKTEYVVERVIEHKAAARQMAGLVILLYKLMSRTGAGGSEKGSRRAVPVR